MKWIVDQFSNRDIALMAWLGIFFLVFLLQKKIRKALLSFFKILFAKNLASIFIVFGIYILGTVLFLKLINLWDSQNLKDTIFWFFGVAIVLMMNIHKAKDFLFFKSIVKDTVKWTIFIEFWLNFYSFSLGVELILLPLLLLLFLIQTVSGMRKEQKDVYRAITNVLSFIGLCILIFVLYKTIVSYQGLLTKTTLISLLLPIILSIMLIPFLYLTAVYMGYERLFVHLRNVIPDEARLKELRKAVFLETKFNINKISKLNINLPKELIVLLLTQ